MIVPSAYYNDVVLFEIVKQLKGRETAFLSPKYPVRCIKAHNISFLRTNMRSLGFWNRQYNVYHSLAHYYNMPMFSFNPETRRKQQDEFNRNFMSYIIGYDLAFDFDSKIVDFQRCYKDTSKLKSLFDDYGVPYTLKMSGSGFHIVVDSQYLPDGVEKVKYCASFVNEMSEVFNLPTLDIGIIDWRRLWKVAYSLDIKTDNVALPLFDEQFEKFSMKMVKPQNCLPTMKNRGLLPRFQDDSLLKLRRNLQSVYDAYVGELI